MQIKKSRLMQIIKEELARIEEVEVQRRGRKSRELELYDRWKKDGDEEAFNALYKPIKPEIEKFVKKKSFRTADDASIEDTAQDVFLKIIENPQRFGGRAALSSFLKGNAVNLTLDRFRHVRDFGGGVTKGGKTKEQSDFMQTAGIGLDLKADVMGGSRNPSPLDVAITHNTIEKSYEKDALATTAFVLYHMGGYTHDQIRKILPQFQDLGIDPSNVPSQPTVSRAIDKAKEIMSKMEEAKSIEEAGGYEGRRGVERPPYDPEERRSDLAGGIVAGEIPKGVEHKEDLENKPFAGKLEEIIAEVVSELMNQ